MTRRSAATRPISTLPCLAMLVLSLTAPRLSHAAWPHDSGVNLPLCTAVNEQLNPTIVADGAGGAIVTWHDLRGGSNYDIYAQHVLASGVVDPAWPANGRALCTAADLQQYSTIVADGAGGAIVTWHDYRGGATADIYAQRVNSAGAPQWAVDGVPLCTAGNAQQYPTIVADGAGGAIVTWQDFRNNTNDDIYVQHVLASGAVDPAWLPNGRALCIAAGAQASPMIVADGAGGAIVTWHDYRGGATTDIYAQHVLASGAVDPTWLADGRALCTATNNQQNPAIVGDGAGGAIVTWQDLRGGFTQPDVYAQHVLASGAVDPAWPANGRTPSTAFSPKASPAIVADGAGGAIITWYDSRIANNVDVYAQHVRASGVLDPAWPANGRALCTAAGTQQSPTIVADGTGGAIVTWLDFRNDIINGEHVHIYAQHVLASGVVDPAWPADGRALSTARFWPMTSAQQVATIVADGAGGAIVTWSDYRGGATADIYAQRVERFGRPGNPEPVIATVRDVPNDQGGKVRIRWRASYLDTLPTLEVSLYGIWHQVNGATALSNVARGARLLRPDDPPDGGGPGSYLVTSSGARSLYWEGLGTVAADGESTYTFLALTLQDSTAASNPYSVFMVDAHGAFMPGFWRSVSDSGYSVDNLPPATPAPFTGQYASGSVQLHWNPNAESDLANYRLYRGNSTGFVPGAGNLIASPPDTGFTDPAGSLYYYKLSAMDIHSNESGFALLLPSSPVDVLDPSLPRELSLARPSPNPALGPITLSFALPRETRVRLVLFDLSGRRVHTFVNGLAPAGKHTLGWDLRDETGARVAGGVYFVRLEAERRTFTRRLSVTR